MYKLTASLRGDAYWVEDVITDPTDPQSREDGFTGRLVPLLALEWRYPFVRSQGTTRQTVEPIVQAVWTPVGGNPDLIPNEDSQSFEFDDTNLFSLDRYPGLDRVEGGFRVNYGTKIGLYGEGGGYTTLLVGQTYRARADETFGTNTGLEDNFSDIVARLDIRPGPYLDLSERIRLDKENYNLNRHEVTLDVGPTDYRFRVGYVSLSRDETTNEFDNREEIYLAGRVKLAEYWSLFGSYRRDLTDGGRSLSAEAGVRYLDECFDVIFTVGRRYTRDRELEPSTNFNLRVRLIPFG
jgi:LPS-assembly protein